MPLHVTLVGEAVSFPDPDPRLAAFLESVRAAVADASVDENAMIRLIYGIDNPLLVQGVIPGRGAVTAATIANPVYRVLLDYLARKQVAAGHYSADELRSTLSVTAGDAAAQLGIAVSSVIRAVQAKRLVGAKIGGTWYLDPRSFASFRRTGRGPKPAGAA